MSYGIFLIMVHAGFISSTVVHVLEGSFLGLIGGLCRVRQVYARFGKDFLLRALGFRSGRPGSKIAEFPHPGRANYAASKVRSTGSPHCWVGLRIVL